MVPKEKKRGKKKLKKKFNQLPFSSNGLEIVRKSVLINKSQHSSSSSSASSYLAINHLHLRPDSKREPVDGREKINNQRFASDERLPLITWPPSDKWTRGADPLGNRHFMDN